MTMGEKILNLRKARGWSQEELAEHIGVTRQAVSRWESGAAKPDTDKVIAICDLFGVSADYLIRDNYMAEASAPAERKPFILLDAIRGMSISQWTRLFVTIGGIVILAFILIDSSRIIVYGDHLFSYGDVWAYLDSNDLYWLWYLGIVMAVGGGLMLVSKPLLGAIKRLFGEAWNDLATFFNWNG